MKFLLDTCTLSEGRKLTPNAGVTKWLGHADTTALFISVLILGELEKGVQRLPEGRKKTDLLHWVQNDVVHHFAGRILPIDESVALMWGTLHADAERRGKPTPVIDGLLAATARVHGLTVVTRNNSDMEDCGVDILNPWESK